MASFNGDGSGSRRETKVSHHFFQEPGPSEAFFEKKPEDRQTMSVTVQSPFGMEFGQSGFRGLGNLDLSSEISNLKSLMEEFGSAQIALTAYLYKPKFRAKRRLNGYL